MKKKTKYYSNNCVLFQQLDNLKYDCTALGNVCHYVAGHRGEQCFNYREILWFV